MLAENATPDTAVYTLDLPPDNRPTHALVAKERSFADKPQPGALIGRSSAGRKVTQLLGDSARFRTIPGGLRLRRRLSRIRKRAERLANSVAMLRDGRGIVVWHDYGEWEGVTRALDSLHLNDGAFSGLRHIRGTTLAILSVK